MPLKVIGAGHGRTGTMSLKLALEQLGFGPCYHMIEVFKNGSPHIEMWIDASEGRPVDWHKLFAQYNSTTDFPAAAYFDQLLKEFPDAKVVLTVRDADAWYNSAISSIYEISTNWAGAFFASFIPGFRRLRKMLNSLWFVAPFNGDFRDKQHALAQFHAHNERVKSIVPADKLLVFDVKEGWAPLCAFLGVPVPNTPFPKVNEQAEFRRRILGMKLAAIVVMGAAAVAVGATVRMVYRLVV